MARNDKGEIFRNLALVSQLGISFVTPLLLCLWIGERIERHFGIRVQVWLILLGVLAGINTVYKILKNIIKQDRERQEKIEEDLLNQQEQKLEDNIVIKPKQASRIFKEENCE